MRVYDGEFVINRGAILERLFIKDNNILGGLIFMPDEKEYFIDGNGFKLLKRLMEMEVEIASEYVNCIYNDTNEAEVFEIELSPYVLGSIPDSNKYSESEKWLKEYIRINKTKKMKSRDIINLVRK